MDELDTGDFEAADVPSNLVGFDGDHRDTDVLFALLVTNMRLYDVMMGMYAEMNPTQAAGLMVKHQQGGMVGSVPAYNGEHIVDEEFIRNTDESSDKTSDDTD